MNPVLAPGAKVPMTGTGVGHTNLSLSLPSKSGPSLALAKSRVEASLLWPV